MNVSLTSLFVLLFITTSRGTSVVAKSTTNPLNTADEGKGSIRGLQQNKRSSPALATIVKTLKGSLVNVNDTTIQTYMAKHYQTLRLMDESGNWTIQSLGNIGETLLPPEVTVSDAEQLLDAMADAASENGYLMDFLDGASSRTFSHLENKVQKEGAQVLPLLISYALVLELLTKAVYEDPELLSVLYEHFITTRAALGIDAKSLSAFVTIKLVSVEKSILSGIKMYESNSDMPEHADSLLTMNVMVAVGQLVAENNQDAARAGTILGFNAVGIKPASKSANGHASSFYHASPKLWNDLFTLWKLAFVSRSGHFPMLCVKLLIPQVHNHAHNPEEFTYNNLIALFIFLYSSMFMKYDALVTGGKPMDWFDPYVEEELGAASLKAARHYADQIGGWKFDESTTGGSGETPLGRLDSAAQDLEATTATSASSIATAATVSGLGLVSLLLAFFI